MILNAIGCAFGGVGASAMVGLWYRTHLLFRDNTAAGVELGGGYVAMCLALFCCLMGTVRVRAAVCDA